MLIVFSSSPETLSDFLAHVSKQPSLPTAGTRRIAQNAWQTGLADGLRMLPYLAPLAARYEVQISVHVADYEPEWSELVPGKQKA